VPEGVVDGPFLRVGMAPVVVDALVRADDCAVKRNRRPCVRGGQGDDGVDRVGLVVGHGEHGARDNAAHGMADYDDRSGIRQIGVARRLAWAVV